MLYRILNRRGFLSLALALSLFMNANSLTAGKGGGKPPQDDPPPEPTPAGTIYFQMETETSTQTWAMDADGNNVYEALPPGVIGYPSSLLYGQDAHRWWLIAAEDGRTYKKIEADGTPGSEINHIELYAVRVDPDSGELVWQQICDSYGVCLFSFPFYYEGLFNGNRPDGAFAHQWSSDGQDTHLFCSGTDISELFDGTDTLDLRNEYRAAIPTRVSVPGGALTIGQSVEMGQILTSDAITMFPGNDWGGTIQLSPDTQTVLMERFVPGPEFGYVCELWFKNTSTGTVESTVSLANREGSRYSPFGDQVAFSLSGDLEGIWFLNQSQTGTGFDSPVPVYLTNSKNKRARDARWSPDAKHLVFLQEERKQGVFVDDLYRMNSDGTGLVKLTGQLSFSRIWPFRWASNNLAP